MPRKNTPHPVEVIWRDAHGMYADWHDLKEPPTEDDESEYTVSTIGYLLPNRKKGHHVVALNLSDHHVGDAIAIPDGMIVKVTKLAPVRKRKPK